ncbi:hypothetical protein SK128_007547, partial [Halocaridina rubra]
ILYLQENGDKDIGNHAHNLLCCTPPAHYDPKFKNDANAAVTLDKSKRWKASKEPQKSPSLSRSHSMKAMRKATGDKDIKINE